MEDDDSAAIPSLRAERSNPSIRASGDNGLLRSARNDVDMTSRSRGAWRPRFAINVPPSRNRGCREDRVRAAPAVSCAVAHKENAHEHTGSAEASRPSLRNGFTAYNELSPV